MKAALILLGLLAVSAPASAQSVTNPREVSFAISPDHAQIDRYDLDIKKADGTVIQTIALAKPTPNAEGIVTAQINVQPVAFGTYTVVVRAIAGTLKSPDSPTSDPFVRAPGAPGKATLR